VIVTNAADLRRPSEPVKDISEGGEVARRLTYALRKHNKKATKDSRKGKSETTTIGVGLAAPQIGVHKQVCCLLINDVPLVLMNPVITEKSEGTIEFTEGCLSFPGEQAKTTRHVWVTVQTLNHRAPITFGPRFGFASDSSVLLSVAAQHEIAHLHGLTFHDFAVGKPSPQEDQRPEAAVDSHPDLPPM
jgi:peptide deformylase